MAVLCRAQETLSVSVIGEARTSRECECAVLLSCVVEVSLTRKRVHARMIVSSVNIVFEDSRGAQVEYTGALCTLFNTQRSTAPVP